jgi:hypothetical protein
MEMRRILFAVCTLKCALSLLLTFGQVTGVLGPSENRKRGDQIPQLFEQGHPAGDDQRRAQALDQVGRLLLLLHFANLRWAFVAGALESSGNLLCRLHAE